MDEEKNEYVSKSLLKAGKVFLNITPSEILTALSLRMPPEVNQNNNKKSNEKSEENIN